MVFIMRYMKPKAKKIKKPLYFMKINASRSVEYYWEVSYQVEETSKVSEM